MDIKFELWLITIMFVFIELKRSILSCQPFCNVPSDWITQARNICYGAKGDDYAEFQIKQDCRLVAIRLSHVSGLLQCHDNVAKTRWGCPNHGISTIIVNGTSRSSLFAPEAVFGSYAGYLLPGFGMNDDLIVLKKNANLTIGEKFHVYYGEDWTNHYELNNEGRHCIDLDISCLV